MTDTDFGPFQAKLGHCFSHPELLQQALTHRSYGKNHNERLEFLGDSLVNAVIAELLYRHYPQVPEGHLSAMRSSLVRRETLADIAKSLGLGHYLQLGGGTLKTGGHRLDSILADAYEAIVAAVYLDSDWQVCARMIATHFQGRLDGLENMTQVRDAKSRLQEYLQSQSLPLPDYQTIEVAGPGHAQRFVIACRVEAIEGEFRGEGSNRRAAEQIAAEQVLQAIEAHDQRQNNAQQSSETAE